MDSKTNTNGANDTGEPIAELVELRVDPRPGFLARLRRRIQRREMTGHLLGLTWSTPLIVLMEFLGMIFEMLGTGGRSQGGSK